MSNFTERLKGCMQPGESQLQFGERIGVNQAQLSEYFNEKRKPKLLVVQRIAKACGKDYHWLLGIESDDDKKTVELRDGGKQVELNHRRIPVVGLTQAGQWFPAEDGGYPVDIAAEYVYSDIGRPDLFAVRIQGDSMLPMFRSGDTLILDPNLRPRGGDYVVAKLLDRAEAVFKKISFPKPGMVLLKPTNPDYEEIVLNSEQDLRIVGVVVELLRKIR